MSVCPPCPDVQIQPPLRVSVRSVSTLRPSSTSRFQTEGVTQTDRGNSVSLPGGRKGTIEVVIRKVERPPSKEDLKRVGMIRAIRSKSVTMGRAKGDVQSFRLGRNILNRLISQSSQQHQQFTSQHLLYSQVQEARTLSQTRSTVRLHDRKEYLCQLLHTGRLEKINSELNLMRRRCEISTEVQKRRKKVVQKEGRTKTVLAVKAVGWEGREHTGSFSVKELKAVLSTTVKPKFR